MKDFAYYETGKHFDPQPGVIYENENGENYVCLNYSLYVNRYNRAEVLPVMQMVTEKEKNWTLFAHDLKMYEDGKISWGFSSGIGFLPTNQKVTGGLDYVNEKLREED